MFPWLHSSSSNNAPLRVVVKIGTQVIADPESPTGLNMPQLTALMQQVALWRQQQLEVVIVTSGAVGVGRRVLNWPLPLSLEQKQACAAVGQNQLMQAYQNVFSQHHIQVAQVLLTAYDLSNRSRYLNLQKTFNLLLEQGVVPIVNENDSVSVAELIEDGAGKSFGDNDMLSALVASKLDAQLLILLSNVDGIYDKNPTQHADAQRINLIEDIGQLAQVDSTGQSSEGRGGMSSKIRAAQLAAYSGVTTLIASGFDANVLEHLSHTEHIEALNATAVLPQGKISSKKRWLGFASSYAGTIIVNPCAVSALIEKHASLLPIGIVDVVGEFAAGAVVSLQDEQQVEIGRGVCQFATAEVKKIMGQHSDVITTALNRPAPQEVIHKDNLVIFKELML